jgi:osmoprotectant transport system ATP-binding protein
MPIELDHVTKKYGDLTAVNDLSLTFEDRTLNVLIGPSGCGKTTLLKTLNRLLPINSGDIRYDGVSIHDINPIELRRSIGYVIQEIGLFPHMTIYENIATVPRLLNWKESKIEARVKELLELVNLDPDKHPYQYPAELSGGQRQRVGVARGLASDPKILLMDEPFGAIDPINRETLQDGFIEIQREIQKTIVFVTHDIREAVKLGDKLVILDQGKLVQYDEVMQIINNPENEFVEDLLGSDRAMKGMELLRVEDNYDTNYFYLTPDLSVADGIKRLEEAQRTFSFVKDDNDKLHGYVRMRDLKKLSEERSLTDVAQTAATINPTSTLMEAISMMLTAGITSAPVVNRRGKMLGVIRFREVFQTMEDVTSGAEEA